MYYDYRDEFNQLIDLLTDVRADFRTFMNTFDSFVSLLTGWWEKLIGFLPQALWFYDLFNQVMAGFSPDDSLVYTCGFLLFLVLVGVFFRFLYSLVKPY